MGTAFLIGWGICIVLGYWVGKSKGYPIRGALMAFAMGLIGLIVLLFLPRTRAAKLRDMERAKRLQAAAWERSYGATQPMAPPPAAPPTDYVR